MSETYQEFMNKGWSWRSEGSGSIDLSAYAKTSDLASYTKKTDYANDDNAGVIHPGNGLGVDSSGYPKALVRSNEAYQNASDNYFISKGTLNNVLNSKMVTIDKDDYDALTEYAAGTIYLVRE